MGSNPTQCCLDKCQVELDASSVSGGQKEPRVSRLVCTDLTRPSLGTRLLLYAGGTPLSYRRHPEL